MSRSDVYIQVRETDAVIQGASDDLLQDLSRELRYRPSGYQFDPAYVHRRWDGWVWMFERSGRFPVGLVPRVQQFLIRKKVRHRVEDIARATQGDPIKTSLNEEIQDRYYQAEAVEAALAAPRGLGIVRAPTGAGKTVMIARLIQRIGQRAVVLVPTVDLLLQTKEFLEWAFGQEIGQMGGGQTDPRDITVATTRTMSNVLRLKYVKYKLDDLNDDDDTIVDASGLSDWVKGIGVLIIDECHIVAADSAYTIATTMRCGYKIGFSASPWRDDNADLKIEAALGAVLYRIGVPELVKGGFLVPALFRTEKSEPPELAPPEDRISKHYGSTYAKLVNNGHRNQVIADLANQLIDENKTILLLISQLKHGEKLRRLIPRAVFIAGSSPGQVRAFYESGDRQRILDGLRNQTIRCVIASSIADMGLDVPALDTLILAGGGKSSTRHLQRIGRVCRPFPGKTHGTVISFDDGWAHLKRRDELDPNTNKKVWIYRPGWFAEHAKARRRIEREEWGGAAVWL